MRTVDQGSGMSVAIQQAGGDYAAIVVSGANRDIDPAQVEASAAAIRDSRVLLLQHEIRQGCQRCGGHARAGRRGDGRPQRRPRTTPR